MKKVRLMLSAFIVFAVVGIALAFTPPGLGQGKIFCHLECPEEERINYEVHPMGDEPDPCEGQEYELVGTPAVCEPVNADLFRLTDL